MKKLYNVLKSASEIQLKKEADSSCHWYLYQPKLPVGLKEHFKK